MYSVTQNGNHIAHGIKKFCADNASDIESAPVVGIVPGSEIFCIENSKTYVFTTEGKWEEKSMGKQEGGGTVPGCGIVPTEFADNGFVLSADSYGDIMPYALYSSLDYECGEYKDLILETNIPESIDVSETWWDDNFPPHGEVSTSFINKLTFKTTPTIIGEKAFYNQKLLQIDELPEGVEQIQEEAFYGCSNLKFSYIPASVQEVGINAFVNSNNPQAGAKNYDPNSTYSIGDVIINNSDSEVNYYTCIYNIETPEEFNSDHWVNIYAPGVVGLYNPDNTYVEGDGVIVYNELYDVYESYTCVEMFVKPQTTSYYKNFKGYYNSNNSYSSGEVVMDRSSNNSQIYTCLVDNPSMSPPEDQGEFEWVSNSYPYIEGSYNSETQYQIGDYIFSHDYHSDYTCYATPPIGSGIISNYWAEGYCPLNEGLYDSTRTYDIGDVVIVNNGGVAAKACTCIVPVTAPEEFDYNKWKDGYYPEISVYSNSVSYNIGDTVVYNGNIHTCIAPTTGNEPDSYTHTSYWSSYDQYDPDVVGIFDDSATYNLGDIVYEDDNFKTILNGGGEQIVLISGWLPDSLGVYDSTRTYLAGDVVVVESEEGYDPQWMVCISPIPVTGEYNSDVWRGLMESSTLPYNKINKLQFLGTPNSVSSTAFDDSGYNMILVPWEEGEGPEVNAGIPPSFVVYGYNPEGE